MKVIVLRHRQRRRFDVCPLRTGHDLGVYLDRGGRGVRGLVGWRIIAPHLYVIVLLGRGRHRAAYPAAYRAAHRAGTATPPRPPR